MRTMMRLRYSPAFWLICVVIWFVSLWVLSSNSHTNDNLPQIANIDKVAHFGFFFGGGGLLSALLYRRKAESPDWARLICTVTLIISAVGVLDEIHQSFTPGRSGNDVYDWMADTLGGLTGAIVFKLLHRWVK